MRTTAYHALLMALVALTPAAASAADFTYNPPGQLVSGSGSGRSDTNEYAPGMTFPIEVAPAFANSQVWGVGGSSGPSGGQCDTRNYSYPWWDNYCESRTWDMPLCPSGKGHQGQDIRPSTCVKNTHWVVSAQDGEVTSIGSYSVTIAAPSGTQHRYLHMEPSSLTVRVGDTVQQGQRIGKVSNAFGDSSTTIHLHYDLIQNVAGVGTVFAPSYMSLVRSYERLLGIPQEPCGVIPAAGATIDNSSACFALGGDTSTWRNEQADGAEGGSLRWTYGYDAAQPSATARWALELERGGRYRVEASMLPAYGQSQRARYMVRHGGADEEVRVNMTGQAGWRVIGEFEFAAGADQYIELRDNTGDPLMARVRIMADAIRLTPLAVQPPEDMGGSPPQDMGVTPPRDMGGSSPDMSVSQPDQGGGGGEDMEEEPGEQPGGDDVSESSCAASPRAQPRVSLLWLLAPLALIRRRWRRV